ncbi:hypothetical protein BDW67DRAFT_80557 [Aspergillus spinulosporus]
MDRIKEVALWKPHPAVRLVVLRRRRSAVESPVDICTGKFTAEADAPVASSLPVKKKEKEREKGKTGKRGKGQNARILHASPADALSVADGEYLRMLQIGPEAGPSVDVSRGTCAVEAAASHRSEATGVFPALEILLNAGFRSSPNLVCSAGHGLPPDGRTEPSVSIRARRIRVIRSSIRNTEVGRCRPLERSRFLVTLVAAGDSRAPGHPLSGTDPTYMPRAEEQIREIRVQVTESIERPKRTYWHIASFSLHPRIAGLPRLAVANKSCCRPYRAVLKRQRVALILAGGVLAS